MSSPQISRLPSGEYQLAGSWLPYGVMMVIFVTKYLLGVLCAQHSPLLGVSASPDPRPLFLIGRPFDQQPQQACNGQMVAFLAHTIYQLFMF